MNVIQRFAARAPRREGSFPAACHHVPLTKFSGDLRNVAIVKHHMQPPIDIFDTIERVRQAVVPDISCTYRPCAEVRGRPELAQKQEMGDRPLTDYTVYTFS